MYDGSYHDVDSSELAFNLAAHLAAREGIKKANPVLLEPVMKVEVTTPEEFMGDIIGDLNSRRGRIEAMEDLMGGAKLVTCLATPATSARCRRAELPARWNLLTTRKSHQTSRRRLSRSAVSKPSCIISIKHLYYRGVLLSCLSARNGE